VATIHDLAPFHLAGKYDWSRMFYGRVVARSLGAAAGPHHRVSRTTALDIKPPFRGGVRENRGDPKRDRPRPVPARRRGGAKAWVAEQHGLTRRSSLCGRLEHPAKNHVRLIGLTRLQAADPLGLAAGVRRPATGTAPEFIHEAVRRSPCARDICCLGFVPEMELPHW